LLNSEEYLEKFGNGTVPYQRQRVLPQRSQGELPFTRMARYDWYHLNKILKQWQFKTFGNSVVDRSAPIYRRILLLVPATSVAMLLITLTLVATPK
jgi:phycobilisome rod-core linker protein